MTGDKDEDGGKFSRAKDEARSHIRRPLRGDVNRSDSDLTDNSSGEQGQARAEKLHADGGHSDDGVCVCVCSDVVEITEPLVNGFDGPPKTTGQKSRASTGSFCHLTGVRRLDVSVDSAALGLTGQRFPPEDPVYVVSDDDDDSGDGRVTSTKPPRTSAALMVNLE